MKKYDLIILGGGSAGFSAALRAVEFGAKVLIIEENVIGGTCVNRGCIPSKYLLYASEMAGTDNMKNIKGIEVKTSFNIKKIMQQKKKIIGSRYFSGHRRLSSK